MHDQCLKTIHLSLGYPDESMDCVLQVHPQPKDVDACVEVTGNPKALQSAMDIVGDRGKVSHLLRTKILTAVYRPQPQSSHVERVCFVCQLILGSWYGTAPVPLVLGRLLPTHFSSLAIPPRGISKHVRLTFFDNDKLPFRYATA